MRTAGVICEFNPFHAGHAHLLAQMREIVGEEGCVVCLMSGRFVQRGSPAVADPYLRARTALAGGADLVLELPFPWSAGSAEHFAAAGVRMLAGLAVDTLVFGSECGDEDLLWRAARVVSSPSFAEAYTAACHQGQGTAAAYTATLRALTGADQLPDTFPSSNDALGIAYIAAVLRLQEEGAYAPAVHVVHRRGAAYRDAVLHADAPPSATALRRVMREAACDPSALRAILGGTMPPEALDLIIEAAERGDAPTDEGALMAFYHMYYRLQMPALLSLYAELGGGLAAHIVRCARETATPDAFFAALRTKQYTDARLRRALLFGLLGITEADLRSSPFYTTLLAANRRGCAFLKERQRRDARRSACGEEVYPIVVTKPADAAIGWERNFAENIDRLFTLCYPAPRAAGEMMKRSPYIAKAESTDSYNGKS